MDFIFDVNMDVVFDAIILIVILYFFKRIYGWLFSSYKETAFGFRGTLVYADCGRKSRSFTNKIFGLSAKPDFIYKTSSDEFTLVEYKGRTKQVYPSDIAQTIASVIAARTKYNIQKAFVHTDTFRKEIDVNKPDHVLYEEIESLVDMTRQIQNKQEVTKCFPQHVKCQTCSMSTHCYR